MLHALKAGTAALNKLHEEMSLEDVEKLMEETNEAIQVILLPFSSLLFSSFPSHFSPSNQIENEISALLAGQFSPIDESELEAELEVCLSFFLSSILIELI